MRRTDEKHTRVYGWDNGHLIRRPDREGLILATREEEAFGIAAGLYLGCGALNLLMARWLMPNDFEPVVGKRFTFTTRPIGDWDGIVQCEVLEVVPRRRLVYSWKGGSDSNDCSPNYGSRLDSVVTWTLQAEGGGTRLRVVHAGRRADDLRAKCPTNRVALRPPPMRAGPKLR